MKKINFGERENTSFLQRKRHKFNYTSDDESTTISGKEHVEEEIEMKQQEQIKSDTSFYQKCKAYLDNVDSKSYAYITLKQAIESYLKEEIDLNEYIKGNIFVTNAECYETAEEISNVLKRATAAVYIILVDKAVTLTGYDNLKDGVSADLSYAIGVDMSGEIMSFLENYEG